MLPPIEPRWFEKRHLFFNALCFFLLLTVAYVSLYDPYKVVGQSLLTNADFKDDFKGWKTSGSKTVQKEALGIVTLSAMPMKRYVFVLQRLDLPSHFSESSYFLHLSGDAETINIVKGQKPWEQARFILFFYDEEGKIDNSKHPSIFLPTGSSIWRHYSNIFKVPSNIKSVQVGAQILQAKGVIRIQNLSLIPVQFKPETRYLNRIGFLGWFLIIVWLMFFYIKDVKNMSFKKASFSPLLWFGVLLFLVALVGMMLPGGLRDSLLSSLPEASYSWVSFLLMNLESIAHFMLFLLASFFGVLLFKEKSWWVIVIDLMLLGLLTELLQLFIEGRTADPMDMLVDYSGIFLGSALVFLISPSRFK